MKRTTKQTPKEESKKLYTVKLSLNNEVKVFKTDDLAEVIAANKPFKINTPVILTVEKEGKKAEKILKGFHSKQLFNNKLFRTIILSRLLYK